MMSYLSDFVIIAVFLSVNLCIGYFSSKKVHTLSHFSVGYRSFSSFFIFCTLSATFIGGGYTLGNVAKAYSDGMMYSFALLGFSVKEILIASFVAPRMLRFNDCHSVGDMMGKQYGAGVKCVTGILSLIVCAGILGAQVSALGAMINSTLPLDPTIGIIISSCVLVAYTALGGMRAVVFTDVFQFGFLLIGIPITFLISLFYVGGWGGVYQRVPATYLYFINNANQFSIFVLLFFTFMFGETLIPPYVQRLFMAKSSRSTIMGTLCSGLVSVPIFLLCGLIGLIAFAYNPQIPPNQAFPYIVQQLLPIGIRGFVIAAMLSIILSSAAGLLNSASIAFVNDILINKRNRFSDKQLLLFARLSTIVVGAIAVIFSLSMKNMIDILLVAYNFWSPIVLVPLLAVIFNKQTSARSFFIGAISGVLGVLLWRQIFKQGVSLSPVIFGIFCNAIGFLLTSAFEKSNGT